MATIKLGGGVTDIRGSIGGTVFSRNAGGAYARQRVKPVNPRREGQNQRRATLSQLTKAWSDVLEETQRADWRAYAAGTTWTNRLGDVITINGLAAFLRLNALLLLAGEAVMADAPLAMGHAGNPTFEFDAETDTTNIELAEPSAPFDKLNVGHRMMFFQALPVEGGRLAGRAGMRHIGGFVGATTPGTVFPVDLDAAYTMAAGQVITVEGLFIDESYRVGSRIPVSVVAGPSS